MPIYFSEMLTVKCHKINMNRQIVWCYLFMLTLMEVVKTKVTEQGNSHGGIQDSLLDGVSVTYQEFATAPDLGSEVPGDGALVFSPPRLQFGHRQLGVPHGERVTLTNRANRTLRLTSISGNTMHFHSSFFEDKVLPPNGNTSFNVVFLGRERGHVEANLFIHTSDGVHKYMMSGTSTPSLYRLQPFVGIRLPQNASFSPLIYIHNPHDYLLQITEVYSSGGGVELELPDGWSEAPGSLWMLPPHSTRPVVAVRYRPHPSQHMAYVRIKVDGIETVLVVAVEVMLSSETGPYAIPHVMDFGYGGTKDPPKQLHIYMGNTSPRPVRITSVSVRPDGGAATASAVRATAAGAWPVTLPPSSLPHTHVATLAMHWQEAFESGQCCGKIIIRTKQGQHKIVLPYISHVLSGGLTFNEDSTRYLTCEGGLTAVRNVMVKNEYKVPVFLTDIVIGEGIDKYFEIKDFWAQNLNPDESTEAFKIRLKSWTESLKFESRITLNTNISTLEIPVFIYNGKLDIELSIKPHATSPTTLNLGLVGASSTSGATVSLRNPNPAAVCLRRSGVDMAGAAVRLMGCEHHHADQNLTACTCIPPDWRAVYALSVVAPAREALLKGELWIQTAHERIAVPMELTAANGGRLQQAEPTHMPDCFPGTECSLPLRIRSSFPVEMAVTSVEAAPALRSLRHDWAEGGTPILAARALSRAGTLRLRPHKVCQQDCYAGLHLNTTVGQQWLSRMSLPSDTLELDTNLVNSRYSLYLNLTSKTPYTNLSIRLDTTQVRNHMLSMRVSYSWPRLATATLLEAPLAQVGRATRLLLRLANPSTLRPVLAQLVVDWMVQGDTQLDSRLLPEECPPHKPCARVLDRVFHFPRDANPCRICRHCLTSDCSGASDTACLSNSNANASPSSDEEGCDDVGNGHTDWGGAWLPGHTAVHPETCAFLLPPGGERNVTVEFYANYSARVSSLLYIRNNLTILEVLRLTGQGVVPSLKFGNRKPGSTTPLLFDLTEKHLKDCDKEKVKKTSAPPNLTVKRTFVARNTGEIPITFNKFFINSIECEGYGFKVLNCEPFRLFPNGTYKVDIAFTPDFTLTKVERMLIIETSLNTAVNYSLISSIPATLAGRCATVLRRPPWEPSLRSAALSLLTCIGVCVLIAGFYDSDRILKVATMALSRESRTVVLPPFNLNEIAMDVNKKVEAWDCSPSPTAEKKQREPPSFKVSSWNFEEQSNFLMEDSKANISQSQKYEEFTGVSKSRKKLGKRNSNPSDGTGLDLAADTELSQAKSTDRKASSTKEQQTNNHAAWKNVFARNSIIGIKSPVKQTSPGNSSDSSDTVKLIPSTQEVPHDKRNKLLEVPKKLTLYNGATTDNQTHTNNAQTHHIGNNKKHAKSKCLTHVHQSHNSCEEDTSSTTTESSNNDEADKENENCTSSCIKSVSGACNSKKVPPPVVAKKTKISVQYKDSYEGDGEDEEYDHKSNVPTTTQIEPNQRWTKNRENVNTSPQVKTATEKTTDTTEKQKLIDITKNSVNIVSTHEIALPPKQNKKETHKVNNKKEKQILSKKRSLDKSFIFGTKNNNDHSSSAAGVHALAGFNMARSSPSTPPAIPTVWENKASFSDVVARSDNSLFAHGFTGHVKEPEAKKPEQKLQSIAQGCSGGITQTHSAILYPPPEKKKPDVKTSTDLGPIGSNFYAKKSPTNWMESMVDKAPRKYALNNTAPIPQPIKKPQPQKLSDNMGLINNNNSFFLPHSYFSGTLPDMVPNNSHIAMPEINTNNYSSVAASSKNNGLNPIGSSLGIQNKPVTSSILQNTLLNKRVDGFNSMQNVNSLEAGNYNSSGASGLPGNLLDLASNQGLLDLNAAVTGIEELTGMEAFDSPMPWDGPAEGNIGLMGNVTESMFDMAYGVGRDFYPDPKSSASAWSGTSLWDQSGRSSGLQASNTLNPHDVLMRTNTSPLQASSSGSLTGTERSQAEWLWGYPGEGGSSARGLGAIGSAPSRPPPGLPAPRLHQQPQYQQAQQPQLARTFDPFHSLSSIWSPGSPLDRWATNQQQNNQNIQNIQSNQSIQGNQNISGNHNIGGAISQDPAQGGSENGIRHPGPQYH